MVKMTIKARSEVRK